MIPCGVAVTGTRIGSVMAGWIVGAGALRYDGAMSVAAATGVTAVCPYG